MKNDNDGSGHDPRTDEGIGELIRSAGARPEIPGDDLESIRQAAGSAWRGMVAAERKKRLRRQFSYAIAASLLLVVFGGWWWISGDAPRGVATVATLELSSGAVEAYPDDGEAIALVVGDTLVNDTALQTTGGERSSSWAALRLVAGQSVRLDAGTRLRLVSDSRIDLERGAIYVDSGPSVPADAELVIHTPLGVVREIGTQYEIRLLDDADDPQGAVRLRVREGSVSIQPNGEPIVATRGEQLTVGSDGSVARFAVRPDATEWSWVLAAAPPLEIEGRSLASYLDWIARETGREVRFADPQLERSADTITLHGTIEGLRPDESVGVILQGSGLDHRNENGTIWVLRP